MFIKNWGRKNFFFALYNVYVRNILYLCTRYHAVLAHGGSEGVGAIFIGTASYNACFWFLETANFNNPVKDIAEWMLRTWLYNAPSVCREALGEPPHT